MRPRLRVASAKLAPGRCARALRTSQSRMYRREALAYRAQLRCERRIERRRVVSLQQLTEVAVDARVQVGVRRTSAARGHVGSEIAALPQMLAAVIHGVLLCQIVAARAHAAREIERKRVIVDL